MLQFDTHPNSSCVMKERWNNKVDRPDISQKWPCSIGAHITLYMYYYAFYMCHIFGRLYATDQWKQGFANIVKCSIETMP